MVDGGASTGDFLRGYLSGRDVPCPVCRYNLRGCGGATCPECGARLDLRVGSIDLRLGPWLLCVLALALPMGFSGICGVAALIGWRNSIAWGGRDWFILGGLWAVTVLYAIALAMVARRRASFLRRTRGAQWTRALLLAAASAVVQFGSLWLLFGRR